MVYGEGRLLNSRNTGPVGRRDIVESELAAQRRAQRLHRQRVHELGELRVRHLGAVDPERLDRHAMLRHRRPICEQMLRAASR